MTLASGQSPVVRTLIIIIITIMLRTMMGGVGDEMKMNSGVTQRCRSPKNE